MGVKNKIIEDLHAALDNAEKIAAESQLASKDKIDNLEQRLMDLEQAGPQIIEPLDATSDNASSTIEALHRQLDLKNDELRDLRKQKDDTQWKLGEHQQWLQDANYRAAGLENDLEEKRQHIAELQSMLESLKRDLEEQERASQETVNNLNEKLRQLEETPTATSDASSTRQLEEKVENLLGEIATKDGRMNELEKAKNDAEWSLGEHRQWLADANNRIKELMNVVDEKERFIDSLKRNNEELLQKLEDIKSQAAAGVDEKLRENDKLRKNLEQIVSELNNLKDATIPKAEYEELKGKLVQLEEASVGSPSAEQFANLESELENIRKKAEEEQEVIENLEKQKNDLEWSLGEHCQWLQDTKNWASSLENELNESRNATRDLEKQLHDANALADDLKRDRSALEDKLEQMEREREMAIKPSDFDALKDELENVKNELEAKRERVSNLESRLADVERFLDEKHQQLCKAISRTALQAIELVLKGELKNYTNAERNTLPFLCVKMRREIFALLIIDLYYFKAQVNVEDEMEKLNHYDSLMPEAAELDNAEMQQLKNRMEEDRKQVDVLRKENERLISDMK
ncbi:unnamed protein product [Gongylonema pulchrum]|uniref:Uncharacterized protein n=1 Tax=Gongylonema pulchrum TaxID=637853 RepID=A0A3P7MUV5_9BILA|nr:unnamed protein product [Gongylonema pulchrum]